MSYGSLHNISHNKPASGTSVGLSISFICFLGFINSGDSPPCIQSILSSIIAEIGSQLKRFVNYYHS